MSIYIYEFKGEKVFMSQRPVRSTVSGDEITDNHALLVRLYDKRFGRVTYLCSSEEYEHILLGGQRYKVTYNPGLYQGKEIAPVSIVNELPKGVYLFTDPLPGFKQSKKVSDTINAAFQQVGDEKVVNNCVLASTGFSKTDRLLQDDGNANKRLIE